MIARFIANFFGHASLTQRQSKIRKTMCSSPAPHESTRYSFSGDACPKKFAIINLDLIIANKIGHARTRVHTKLITD